jgi:hypothetical protein
MDGICTLANDYVYDQLVALLNSIEAVQGSDMPVCIYPYDDRTERIEAEIAKRPNVQLYRDQASMYRWDQFVRQAWDTHPTARQIWNTAGSTGYHRVGTHRRYCAFDGPFDRFIYMDADTLLMAPVDRIFAQLETADWVVYDFQYKDPTHVYTVSSPKLTQVFPQERLDAEIFCSGFYAARRGLFDESQRAWLLQHLRQGEAEILYPMAPDQTLLNYMVMRSQLKVCNLAHALPEAERTGCCVTSDHFQERDHLLYDRDQRLTYIHYIGISSKRFSQLCTGENVAFPYRDLFLHYRYLHEPDQRPFLSGPLVTPAKPPNLLQRGWKKLSVMLSGGAS